LVKLLGNKDIPACGAAAGVERIISLMKDQEVELNKEAEIHVFLAQLGNLAKRKSLKLFEEFRKAKIRVAESFGRDSLKAQLNRADKIGAQYTLIIGQKEALDGVVIIRNMASGKQETVKLEEAVARVKKKIK
jgi:histidyl-tRNA synthetase